MGPYIANATFFQNFEKTYHSGKNIKTLTVNDLGKYANLLPENIIEFYMHIGIGSFNNGHLFFVDPKSLKQELTLLLKTEKNTYIPIARTAFGDIFYYRYLGETISKRGIYSKEYDICIIDVHYKKIQVCQWSFESFLNDYLCNPSIIKNTLMKNTFERALNTLGELKEDEMYTFSTALSMGGKISGELEKIKLKEYLNNLPELTI